ncbi:MAG TPA: AtpZ/AtpI family protein [Gemmatimonas sp.]|uniref:AtpZ/AtpI family protein n=1 Tax=Gemmatimonas sp. TaxID=1962908 RepID=UPI002ED79E84
MAENPHRSTPPSTPTGEVSPWALAGLGMQFFAAILLFVYVGNWMDRRFDTAPLFLLSGVLVGGGGAFYSGYRRVTAAQRDTRASSDRNDDSTP